MLQDVAPDIGQVGLMMLVLVLALVVKGTHGYAVGCWGRVPSRNHD